MAHMRPSRYCSFFYFPVVFSKVISDQIFANLRYMTSENKKPIPFPKKDFPKILRSTTYQSYDNSHSQLRTFNHSKNPTCLPINSTSEILSRTWAEVVAYRQKFFNSEVVKHNINGGKLLLIGRSLCQWGEFGANRQKFVSMVGVAVNHRYKAHNHHIFVSNSTSWP